MRLLIWLRGAAGMRPVIWLRVSFWCLCDGLLTQYFVTVAVSGSKNSTWAVPVDSQVTGLLRRIVSTKNCAQRQDDTG